MRIHTISLLIKQQRGREYGVGAKTDKHMDKNSNSRNRTKRIWPFKQNEKLIQGRRIVFSSNRIRIIRYP